MKRNHRTLLRTVWGGTAGLTAMVGGSGPAWAQEMIQPVLTLPSQEAAAGMLQEAARTGLFRLGPFDVFPRVAAAAHYDDNIFIDPTDREEDVVWTISPGLSAVAVDDGGSEGAARTLHLDYTPTFVFYTHHSSENAVYHAGSFGGTLPFTKLTLGFNQTVSYSEGPVVDVGARADQLLLSTLLTSRYALGEKTSVEVNGALSVSDYSGSYTTSWDWSNQDWFNYQVGPKLTLGLGLVLGYVDLKDSTDQNYENLLVRAVYALAEKVALNASVGADWRQYRSGVDDTLNPVWNLGLTYQPWDNTALSLGLYQRYAASALYSAENYLNTGVSFSLRQRFLEKFSANLSGSYANADYEAIQAGTVANRSDNIYEARASLDYQIRDRWSVSLFYAFQSDQSNLEEFTFNRNQVGLQTVWAY